MPNSSIRRLPWERRQYDAEAGFVAYPEGQFGPAKTTIIFKLSHPAGSQWAWTASWFERFTTSGTADSKQSAADAATEAYWRGVDASPDWVQRPAGIIADLESIVRAASDEELTDLINRYREARAYAKPIEISAGGDQIVLSAGIAERTRRANEKS